MNDERETYSIEEFRRKAGISRGLAYEEAKSGSLGGVPVLRIGHRLLVPRAAADRVLRGEPA